MSISVRRIRSDEALQLREIRLAALADAPHAFTTKHAEMVDKPLAFWADRVEQNADGYDSVTFIAEEADNWVGMVAGFHPVAARDAAELVAMWVSPAGRGTGAGAAMIEALAQWTAEAGDAALELWVVHGNEPALKLYRRCGFEIVEDPEVHPEDPCIDEIRMRRPVR